LSDAPLLHMSDKLRPSSAQSLGQDDDFILKEFDDAIQTPDIPVAVAAITALTGVLKRSHAKTAMQLQTELRLNVEKVSQTSVVSCVICPLTHFSQLQKARENGVQEFVQLRAACELFMRYVTRTSNDELDKTLDETEFKRSLIRRGDGFKDQSIRSRDAIAKYGSAFVRDGATLLLHGYSSVVMRLLEKVSSTPHF
jgi:translation initiation factor 2B subunit (eIF-2B alpha/beta/delta family)